MMSEHIGAEEAQALLDAATPGPWEACTTPHPDDERTPAEWMASCLNGDGPLWCVTAPNSRGDDLAYLVPAVTGDGPCSEAHAEMIAAAPRLAAEVVRFRRELDARTDPKLAQRLLNQILKYDTLAGGPPRKGFIVLDDVRAAAARLLGGGE